MLTQRNAKFVGPSASYVLGDNVFASPFSVINRGISQKLLIGFDFNDTLMAQQSVVGPVTTLAGPVGSQSVVQISGFAVGDQAKEFPITYPYHCLGDTGQ